MPTSGTPARAGSEPVCCAHEKMSSRCTPRVRARVYDAWITGRKGFQTADRARLPLFEAEGKQVKVNPLVGWSASDPGRGDGAPGAGADNKQNGMVTGQDGEMACSRHLIAHQSELAFQTGTGEASEIRHGDASWLPDLHHDATV